MIRRILTTLFPPTKLKRLVGADHLGNKYYEQEKADGKMRRFFERNDELNPDEYEPGMIPNLWETWIRGRSVTPPTIEIDFLQFLLGIVNALCRPCEPQLIDSPHEEIQILEMYERLQDFLSRIDLLQREKMQEIIAIKAEEIKRRDDEAQEKAFEEGLISRSLEAPKSDFATKQIGHASTPYFGPSSQDADPTTVGTNFEPGAWKPQSKTTKEIDDDEEHNFQPQSWTPNKTKS